MKLMHNALLYAFIILNKHEKWHTYEGAYELITLCKRRENFRGSCLFPEESLQLVMQDTGI